MVLAAEARPTAPGGAADKEKVPGMLSEPRMNRSILLPECLCLKRPRVVSYSEVGDPEGFVAFLMLGVDSHRYLAWIVDEAARARGVRFICLDRPGRGLTSDLQEERANRVLEFPEILRAFCKASNIKVFALLGQSFGATYALRCAQKMPDMVATTVYLISPWVPLFVPGSNRALAFVERLPSWLVKGALRIGTAMPRLLASAGGLNVMAKGCSEAEAALFTAESTAEVLKAVAKTPEAAHGVILDALAALEKEQPLGFDYRDVSMPVHVFHGRADNMVPVAAAQWMAEEMPACTVSVKMGGTHALVMDPSVMDCVLECMGGDFKHFKEHAAKGKRGLRDDGKGPAFSFPAHAQHFQTEGPLLCLRGMLLKGWEPRYFILDGYQLYEFESSNVARARHVVDLRGSSAHVPVDGGETRANPVGDRIFEFRLEDANHKCLYDLGASTAGERASWMETLTKASRFTKGFGEEERQGALTKRFLVTKRPENRRGFGLGDAGVVGSESSAHGRTEWSGLVMTGRRAPQPTGAPSLQGAGSRTPPRATGAGAGASSLQSLAEHDAASSPATIRPRKRWNRLSVTGAKSPGDVMHRRSTSRDLLHGTPLRRRSSLSYDGPGMAANSNSDDGSATTYREGRKQESLHSQSTFVWSRDRTTSLRQTRVATGTIQGQQMNTSVDLEERKEVLDE